MTHSISRHDPVTILEHFRHERTSVFFAYWLSLNEGRMPHSELWDPIKVHKSMPWCTIIERGGETGFQLRFAGTAICDFYGEEMTGQAVGNRMDDETRAYYFSNMENILRRPCATLMTTSARSDIGRDCLFECLSLPVANAEGQGIRVINHQVIIEDLTYGETKTRFAMPEVAAWIDTGEGTPKE